MPSLNIRVSKKAGDFAAAEAARQGLPSAAAFVEQLVEDAALRNGSPEPSKEFHDTKADLNDIIESQGVQPVSSIVDLVADFWPEDESADDLIAAVREWRRSSDQGHPVQ